MAKSNKVLTIDITNESITIIEATASAKKQTSIHNALIFETPEESYEDGQIRDKEKIAGAIREQLSANGITNKNVIFILTSTKAVNREVLIPFVKDSKIKGIINANSSEYFPVNIEDYVVSHSVLETVVAEDKTKQLRVLAVAAPLAMVKSYYDLASMIGLTVQAIDYIGNSMLQLIKTQTSTNTTTMVIQLGSESTVLNIVKGDTLLLQRTVPYGTSAVVTEIMDEKGVDATTAMTLLQNERLITVDFDDNAATGAFRYLINNIGRVMDYYASKNPDKPIDDVFLTGDGALIRGIDGLFKIQLNISTRIMDSLYNIKFDPKINLKIYNPVYLIAPIGAALAPMNFVPSDVSKTVDRKGQSQVALVGCILLIVVSLAGIGISMVAKSNAQKEKDVVTNKINSIKDIEDIIAKYDQAEATLSDANAMYNGTMILNENMKQFIDNLEKVTPSDIAMRTFESNSNGVKISAESQTYDSIGRYIVELRKIDCIDNAFIMNLDEEKDDKTGSVVYKFNITCTYVDQNVEEVVEEADGAIDTTEAE